MSKYSGKCDFADTWGIHGEEYILNSNIYIGDNIIPLRIDSFRDALPYFPHLVFLLTGDNVNKRGEIWLSEDSFVDREERDRFEWILNDIKRINRRCKRKKVPFTIEEVIKEFSFYGDNSEAIRKMFEAVKASGDKAEIPCDIHSKFHDYERLMLYKDMVAEGYKKTEAAKWCFGFYRCVMDDLPEEVKGVMG